MYSIGFLIFAFLNSAITSLVVFAIVIILDDSSNFRFYTFILFQDEYPDPNEWQIYIYFLFIPNLNANSKFSSNNLTMMKSKKYFSLDQHLKITKPLCNAKHKSNRSSSPFHEGGECFKVKRIQLLHSKTYFLIIV